MNNQTKQNNTAGLPQKARRPLIFVVVGIILICLGLLLAYSSLQSRSPADASSRPVTYSIDQAVTAQPQYKKSSFFDKTPDSSNTAFIANITDTIDVQYDYTFRSSEAADVSYEHQTRAVIKALFGTDRSVEGAMSTVWSKQFVLTEPITGKKTDASLSLNPIVRIPYAEYKKQMEQFRDTFSTPTSGELVVTHKVKLTGNVRGIPIEETKISTIKAPLDQQVFKLTNQFEKTAQKEVVPQNGQGSESLASKLELPAAIALIAVGLSSSVYGFRKRKIKSPHQRELEKIYRYHDGIIIHAKHLTKLINKEIVRINSFDDMLNLSEELKTPIIATKVSDYTTHFFITRDDIAYVYTHGIQIPFDKPTTTHTNG